MNTRLLTMAKHIKNGRGFIDVGTDHGYLPVWMARNGYSGNIIASDINEQPLQKAVNTAREAGLDQRIEFQLCDGLSKCQPDKIDTIVIAGMGGDMICHILDVAEWCMSSEYTLILQPMTKAEILRYWLVMNEFEILNEELVEDNGSIYQVIVARFGGCTRLLDAELFIGKRNLCNDSDLYEALREKLIKRFSAAVEGMEQNRSGKAPLGLQVYRNILSELKEKV